MDNLDNLDSHKKQQGFTLIEVLVAGLVVTIGLVGMVLLQGQVQNQAFNAHHRTLAGIYSQDLQERLRANLCYLSKEEPTFTTFIENDLNSFLNDLRSDWEDDHFRGGRAGWTSILLPNFDEPPNLTWQEKAAKINADGYWRFDLEIMLAAGRVVNQSLVVEYGSACE